MKIESEQEMMEFGEAFIGRVLRRVGDAHRGTPAARSSASTVGDNARQDPPAKETSEADLIKSGVIELIGDVGAGKTTFVRGLAKGLGIKEPVTSPSFTISKSYALPSGGNLVHYDFYRLEDPGLMAEDLAENISNPKNIVVIEWGESVKDLLPEAHTKIKLELNDDSSREVTIS